MKTNEKIFKNILSEKNRHLLEFFKSLFLKNFYSPKHDFLCSHFFFQIEKFTFIYYGFQSNQSHDGG